jgi:Predicted glycosylase
MEGGQAILKPQFPWEFVQIGNCGSPIELEEGWLLLTHGVGPVRKYSIGAVLLDKRDPPGFWRVRASRCCGPSHPSAKDTFPTWSTPAGR